MVDTEVKMIGEKVHSEPPRRTSMTFWHKRDPVKLHSGNTDHWTRLKARAEERGCRAPPGSAKAFDCYVYRAFNCDPPGDYYLTRPKLISQKDTVLLTKARKKAKEGYPYWEKMTTVLPPITKSGYTPISLCKKPQPDEFYEESGASNLRANAYTTPWE